MALFRSGFHVLLLLLMLLLLLLPLPSTQQSGMWLTKNALNSLGFPEFTKEDPTNSSAMDKMGHRRLRVAVEEWEPHVRVVSEVNGSFTIHGPMANLIRTLADALNFSYTLVRPSDGAWGAPDSDGNWNGMIGMVKRNEADLALGPFGLTDARAKVVDFSQPIMIDYYKILVRRGRPLSNPWGFLYPLQPVVWLGLWLAFVLACVTLALATIAYRIEHSIATHKLLVFLQSTWDQLSILFQQTLQNIPENFASRALIGLWLLTVLVIMRSYSGALTSLLAVRNIPVKINSLKDLVDAKDYGLLFEDSTALTTYMSEVKSGIYYELGQTKVERRAQFMKPNELFMAAFTLVRQQDFALLVEEATVKKIVSDDFSARGLCDYYIARETYFPLIFCLIGHQGHPLMPFINYKIQSIVEHDLYSNWVDEELNNVTACLKAPTSITVNEPYSIQGLWGVFTVLFGGLLLSAVTFVSELLTHRWASRTLESALLLRPVSSTSL